MHVAAVIVGEEGFAALRDPAHRAAEATRGPQYKDVFGVDPALHAERAADITGENAHHRRLNLEQAGERRSHGEGALIGRVQHEASAIVDEAERAARFHRACGDAGDVRRQAGDVGGVRKDRIERLHIILAPDERDVVGDFVPNGGRACDQSRSDLGNCVERIVVDLDQFARGLGLLGSLGDDQHDAVADVANTIASENRPTGLVRLLAVGLRKLDAAREIADAVGGEVGGGEDRQHARRGAGSGRVDAFDFGVRIDRADRVGVREARHPEIGDIAAAACRQSLVFKATQVGDLLSHPSAPGRQHSGGRGWSQQ